MTTTRRQFLTASISAGLVAGLPLPLRARAARPQGTPDFRALAAGLDGVLVLPGDPRYPEAHRLYQPRFDTTHPAAVAYPAHAHDVATCLAFVRRDGVRVVPRGGGHNYAGWSTGTGLVIDLSAVAGVSLGSGDAVIGAGARLSDVDLRLAAAGVATPTGLCPSVSLAGLALGGGLGVTSRAYGTTSDNITAAEIVTVDGRIRTVDATHEPQLFWALRGAGGGNFGLVTRLRLNTHPAPDCAHAEYHWNGADAAALIPAWQRWVAGLPDHVWSELVLDTGVDGPAAPYVGAIGLDGAAELTAHLDDLAALTGAAPADTFLAVRSYGDTMRKLAGCLDGTPQQCHVNGRLPGHDPSGLIDREDYAARSDFWSTAMPDGAVAAVLNAVTGYPAAAPPGGQGTVQFHSVGGSINRVAPGATAYVHREATYLAQYLTSWPTDATTAQVATSRAWLNSLWSSLRPWASGQAYQNYADPDLTTWRSAYYGANLHRLQQVKAAYDPQRVLSFPQGI